jgi:hypothetical protein
MDSVWLDSDIGKSLRLPERKIPKGRMQYHKLHPLKAERIVYEQAIVFMKLMRQMGSLGGANSFFGTDPKLISRSVLLEAMDIKNMGRRQAERIIGRDLRKATDRKRSGREIINVTEKDIDLILTA